MTTGIATHGVVRASDAVELLRGPLGASLLAGADATAGAAAFVVHPLAPRALGAPVHTHAREDEWSFVLEGALGILVGDRHVVAHPGDLVLKPRGVPHAFWNAADEPTRFLEVITPGGFEGYFAELGEVLGDGGPPDPAALLALADRYGLQMDPASIPVLAAEHGLVIG